MNTKKFIQCIKNYPILYNTQHPEYRSFSRKTAIWDRIAEEMNEPSDVMRTKWKGLKDGYTKYRKWALYRHPSAKPYSHWCWGPYLEFLDPYICKRRTDNDNINIRATKDSNTSESTAQDSQEKIQEGDDKIQTEYIVKIENSDMSTPCTSRSQSPSSLRDPIMLADTDDKEKLLNFIHTKRSNEIGPIDLLFMSYADTFKSFSIETQTKLKVQLATMFAEAELQEHNSKRSVLS